MKTKQVKGKLVKGQAKLPKATLKPLTVRFVINPSWNKQLKKVSAEVKKLSKIPYMTVKV